MNDIQTEIVAELLMDTQKIKVIDLQSEWFTNRSLQEIVATIIKDEGNQSDLFILIEEIKEDYPNTIVTENLLVDLASNSVSSSQIKNHAQQLKKLFYKSELQKASEIYINNPTKQNQSRMKDKMIAYDGLDQKERDGTLDDAINQIEYDLDHVVESGVMTFRNLDRILGEGFPEGTLTTIGARPAVGKTSFGINLAVNGLINQTDVTEDFFTLEMTDSQMLKRFISRLTEINSYRLNNPSKTLKPFEKVKVIERNKWLKENDFRIYSNKFTVEDIARTIRQRAYEAKGKYIAFIDYLQLVKVRDSNKQRYLQIGEITRTLKLLANELKIPIVIFSQLSRSLENRQDKTPTLADLRESGDIEQDSDIVMFIHQPEEEMTECSFNGKKVDTHETVIIVAKNRNGATAKIEFKYFKSIMYFEEGWS